MSASRSDFADRSFSFAATALNLPCNVSIPHEIPSNNRGLVALICHPMALLGGDKDNYICHWVQSVLVSKLKIPAIRYTSVNTSIRGWGEASDAEHLVEWTLGRTNKSENESESISPSRIFNFEPDRVLFVGYSAGGNVALRIGYVYHEDPSVVGVISLSPPFGWIGSLALGGLVSKPYRSVSPLLVVCGTSDAYASESSFVSTLKSMVGEFTEEEIKSTKANGSDNGATKSICGSRRNSRTTNVAANNAVACFLPAGQGFTSASQSSIQFFQWVKSEYSLGSLSASERRKFEAVPRKVQKDAIYQSTHNGGDSKEQTLLDMETAIVQDGSHFWSASDFHYVSMIMEDWISRKIA